MTCYCISVAFSALLDLLWDLLLHLFTRSDQSVTSKNVWLEDAYYMVVSDKMQCFGTELFICDAVLNRRYLQQVAG